ncbi:hypothetical protein JVU11DRAFT_10332 [Chiua virens]|nr:hypothetical protein JVU11DRAFT_10332 [Chiua virens]
MPAKLPFPRIHRIMVFASITPPLGTTCSKSQSGSKYSSWESIAPPAWSSDGRQVYVASPGNITVFDTSTRSRSEWRIHGNESQQVPSIVSSGKYITYFTGSSVSFWDPDSREQIGQIIKHTTSIHCIAISHDGRRLACGHGGGITVHSLEGLIPEDYLPGILCLPLMRVSATALKSWVQGDPMETEAMLSHEIAQRSNPTHDALAICALIRTHLGEWKTALETTEKSLQIKPSPIGEIARSIALVGAGEQELALSELDLVFWDCDACDTKFLLVIKSILLFVCNKRKDAISHLRRFVDTCDEKMKDMHLQVLGMMYLKQSDYGNAVQTLGIVKKLFTVEDRGYLMTLFIIFNWNFENLKVIAWQRACERLYATGSAKEVGDTLLKMVSPLPENEKEPAHGHILEELITRSGDVTLLAWTGKSSTCNSCLPSSPAGLYSNFAHFSIT